MDQPTTTSDAAVIAALRGADESAFVAFATTHQASLMRLARVWVKSPELAEEIVQEMWLTMLQAIDRFEGRSTLKTWLCGILVNVARTRIRQESHSVPMSSLGPDEPAVDPSKFSPAGVPWEGHWWPPPEAFPDTPEARVLTVELRAKLEDAVSQLPEAQRAVLVLQDVEGLSGPEVCNVLGLSDTNQRVLLHRARSKMRALLEQHYQGSQS